MSGSVSFNYIPPNLRVPLFYVEFDGSRAGYSQPVQRTLILGQATSVVPSTLTYIPSVATAQSLFGAGSQLAQNCRGSLG